MQDCRMLANPSLRYLGQYPLLLVLAVVSIPKAALNELPHDPDSVLTSGECLSRNASTLTLQCSQQHMVKLLRIFYGHSANGVCTQSEGDCVRDLPKEEYYPCVGRQECQINLPTGGRGRVIPTCDLYSTYIQAHHECIPESSVMDICQHSVLRQQTGYIKSPRYPNNYPASRNCTLTISTGFSDQKIKLYVIDMNLATKDGKCLDSLHVHDGYHDYNACGLRSRQDIFTSIESTMEIRFFSTDSPPEDRRKGFWLYYEASPYMTTTTGLPTTPPTVAIHNTSVVPLVNVTDTNTNIVGVPTDDSKTTHLINIRYTVSNFPIGLLLGVIFGVVLCVLAIVLLVLAIRSRRAPPANLPNSASKMSTSSTAAFLSEPKNNIEKAQCSNIAYQHSDLDTGPRGEIFLEVNCRGQGNHHDFDLESAKDTGKDLRVIENPGVLELDMEPQQKHWAGPYIDRDCTTGADHLYC